MQKLRMASLVLSLALLSGGACLAQAPAGKNPGKPVSKNKPIKLFNGRNLDGWYTFLQHRGRDTDPKQVFTVKNKMIRISGEEFGCITTNEEYENYKLTAEFKWGPQTFPPREHKARDNGILVHSQGEDGGYSGIWMHSIECQIIEGGTGDILVVGDKTDKFSATSPTAPEKHKGAYVYQPGGQLVTINGGRINWWGRDPEWQDVLNFRGKQDVERPIGQWNKLECIAEGDSISIFLNGVLVNKAFNVRPSRGRIQIQSEGAEIFFRRILLQKIESQ
ncbi:MAG TPA: DUF1080 domain-containing protein [Flavitalea sp.]|nr:DUF1080 domain-containing protein [Flavitalea sp.]